MQRPPVIRIDNRLARTAFAVHSLSLCHNKKWVLEVRRAGIEKVLFALSLLEIDTDNRLVFDWGHRLRHLKSGLYCARLLADGVYQDEVLLQLDHGAKVTHADVVNIDCCEPLDECGQDSDKKSLYAPPYTVPLRSC